MVSKRSFATTCREQYGDGCMKKQIVNVHLCIFMVGRPYVIVDGHNLFHDNVCKNHRLRLCSECQVEQETCSEHGTRLCKKRKCQTDMKKKGLIKYNSRYRRVRANTEYEPKWERTLDISRLIEVDSRITKKGYHPLIYIYFTTYDYMIRNVEKYSEIGPKLAILDDLDKRARLVQFEPSKPPGVVDKTDDPNWDDDLWIIDTAIQLEKSEGVDCFIMSKDTFTNYRKEELKSFIQFEWSWKKIDKRKIVFSWMPESNIHEQDPQTLVSPKLDTLKPIVQTKVAEYHSRVTEIKALEQKMELLKGRVAELATEIDPKIIEKDYVLPEILRDSQEEPFVNPLKKFQKDVQTAVWWVTENEADEDGRIKSVDIWSSLKMKIIPDIVNIDGSDAYLKDKLGFSANTEIMTILEYAVLIYQDSTGIELKFSPNQELLTVIK